MFLRQYAQTIVLPIKMPQCNRWVPPKECTKARIEEGLELPMDKTRGTALERRLPGQIAGTRATLSVV